MPTTVVRTISAEATTTTVSEQPTGPKQDPTDTGIKAGAGTAVPLLVLIGISVSLWRRHRRRRRAARGVALVNDFTRDSASTRSACLKWYGPDQVRLYELDAVAVRVESPLRSPIELPGSEGERQRHQTHQQPTCHNNL